MSSHFNRPSAHGGPRAASDEAGNPSDPASYDGGDWRPSKVVVIKAAKAEGREILVDMQYAYVVDIVKRLSDFGNKAALADLRISQFGEFWALKLKGSFLGKINLRIYFGHSPHRGEVVVLKTYKKEEDRQVSPHVRITLEDRMEDYLAGERIGVSVYERRFR
jgi:hypothetical protein